MMLRRFGVYLVLLVLPWLVIVTVPQFQQQVWGTIYNGPLAAKPTPWTGFVGAGRWWSGEYTPRSPVEKAEYVLRNAGRTKSGWVSNLGRAQLLEGAKFSDLYPHDAAVVAFVLRHTQIHRDGRVEYQLAVPEIGITVNRTSDFTPDLVRVARSLVERGRKLEPENAFFDWVGVRLLLVERRDKEALELLKQAARKPSYNEHLSELMQAQRGPYETRRPLLPEEIINTAWGITLPELSIYRHVNGTLLWRLAQLEDSGRHEEAISVGQAMRRLYAMQMQASPFKVTALNAGQRLQSVWRSGHRLKTVTDQGPRPLTLESRNQRRAESYFRYLVSHGHKDLLPEARSQLQLLQSLASRRPWHDSVLDSMSNRDLVLINVWWSAGGLALCAVMLCVILWLLTWPLVARLPISIIATGSLPGRMAVYPQVLAMSAAALCLGFAAYWQCVQIQEPLGCVVGPLGWSHPVMWLSGTALALPFVAMVVVQGYASIQGVKRGSSSGQPGLGLPQATVDVLWRRWGIYGPALLILGLQCAPITCLRLFQPEPFTWENWADLDVYGVLKILPPVEWVQYVAPGVLVLGWFVVLSTVGECAQRLGRNTFLLRVHSMRRHLGVYATIFSWLLLGALFAAVPHRKVADGQWNDYLKLEPKISRVGVPSGVRVEVPLRTLPSIPKVWPTPTPIPTGKVGVVAPSGVAPTSP